MSGDIGRFFEAGQPAPPPRCASASLIAWRGSATRRAVRRPTQCVPTPSDFVAASSSRAAAQEWSFFFLPLLITFTLEALQFACRMPRETKRGLGTI
jgi:hypothetical protein